MNITDEKQLSSQSQMTSREDLNSFDDQDPQKRRFDIDLTEPNSFNSDITESKQYNGNSNSLHIGISDVVLTDYPTTQPEETFQAIQKWEGKVISISEETFNARISPLIEEGPEQEVEIYLQEITDSDHYLIEPGAIFYWSIGYLNRPSGRIKSSVIRFRRIPTWTAKELKIKPENVTELSELLDG